MAGISRILKIRERSDDFGLLNIIFISFHSFHFFFFSYGFSIFSRGISRTRWKFVALPRRNLTQLMLIARAQAEISLRFKLFLRCKSGFSLNSRNANSVLWYKNVEKVFPFPREISSLRQMLVKKCSLGTSVFARDRWKSLCAFQLERVWARRAASIFKTKPRVAVPAKTNPSLPRSLPRAC